VPDRRLCVVLLPDGSEPGEHAEALLRAPGAVAVEPAAVSYRTTGRMPALMRDRIALGQARRMGLPGHPWAVAAFAPEQYPLARALLTLHPRAELWYGGSGPGDLHHAAVARAALTFSDGELLPLWERMEALEIESGRLGSERGG
jgi:hypothetical protein